MSSERISDKWPASLFQCQDSRARRNLAILVEFLSTNRSFVAIGRMYGLTGERAKQIAHRGCRSLLRLRDAGTSDASPRHPHMTTADLRRESKGLLDVLDRARGRAG